jgi:hypothetical protein
MKRLTFVVILVVAMLFAVTTISTAQTIYGCYSTKNGALRIVPEGISCGKSETPISWNSQPSGGITGKIYCKTNPTTGYSEGKPAVLVFAFGHSYVAVTDWDGRFTLSNLPDGDYDIATIVDGFWPFEIGSTSVTVTGGEVIDIGTIFTFKPGVCYDPNSTP